MPLHFRGIRDGVGLVPSPIFLTRNSGTANVLDMACYGALIGRK